MRVSKIATLVDGTPRLRQLVLLPLYESTGRPSVELHSTQFEAVALVSSLCTWGFASSSGHTTSPTDCVHKARVWPVGLDCYRAEVYVDDMLQNGTSW